MDFLAAVNDNLVSAFTPGSHVCMDESMIKSFHRHLTGKIKIMRKPRPIGNEIKDISDSRSNVVFRMELYEGREAMQGKEFVDEYGATAATSLRLTSDIQGSGRTVIADSWFGSVKTAICLRKRGLHSIMLVKTAHRNFPKELLNETPIRRGDWVAYSGEIQGVNLQAVAFMDLQKKQFISTCSTSIPGNPRHTKHHGDVSRPKVAEEYLSHAASIDIHNHFRTGALGLEDVVKTHSPHLRQVTGILGFLFTNAYLSFRYFKPGQSNLKHGDFKFALSAAMVQYTDVQDRNSSLRSCSSADSSIIQSSHKIVRTSYPTPCYMCRHSYAESRKVNTTFRCQRCEVAICKPSNAAGRICWEKHLDGLPQKRRMNNKK